MTAIQWTDSTANFFVGCTIASSGCKNCYAAALSPRLSKMGQEQYSDLSIKDKSGQYHFNGNINANFDAAINVIKSKNPKKIFVSSMTDFFHPNVPIQYQKRALEMMNQNDHHTYQILTKRPHRIERVLRESGIPLPAKTWIGTTVEGEEYDVNTKQKVIRRTDYIRNMPVDVRFISVEPFISPILFIDDDLFNIDWIIIGGESGQKSRPLNLEWVMDLIQNIDDISQRLNQKIAIFVKQPGRINYLNGINVYIEKWEKQSKAPDSWPKWMRRREMPVSA